MALLAACAPSLSSCTSAHDPAEAGGNQPPSAAESHLSQAKEAREGRAGAWLCLELHPLSDEVSKLLGVDESGVFSETSYSRYGLEVRSIRTGQISAAALQRLRDELEAPEYLAELNASLEADNRIEEGDILTLHLRLEGGATLNWSLLFHRAPASVRSLFEELPKSADPLHEDTLVAAYLRAQRLAPERSRKLREAGRLEFYDLSEVSAELRPDITRAMEELDRFHRLEGAEYAVLESLFGQQRTVFLVWDESGYELTLFHSNPDTQSPEE